MDVLCEGVERIVETLVAEAIEIVTQEKQQQLHEAVAEPEVADDVTLLSFRQTDTDYSPRVDVSVQRADEPDDDAGANYEDDFEGSDEERIDDDALLRQFVTSSRVSDSSDASSDSSSTDSDACERDRYDFGRLRHSSSSDASSTSSSSSDDDDVKRSSSDVLNATLHDASCDDILDDVMDDDGRRRSPEDAVSDLSESTSSDDSSVEVEADICEDDDVTGFQYHDFPPGLEDVEAEMALNSLQAPAFEHMQVSMQVPADVIVMQHERELHTIMETPEPLSSEEDEEEEESALASPEPTPKQNTVTSPRAPVRRNSAEERARLGAPPPPPTSPPSTLVTSSPDSRLPLELTDSQSFVPIREPATSSPTQSPVTSPPPPPVDVTTHDSATAALTAAALQRAQSPQGATAASPLTGEGEMPDTLLVEKALMESLFSNLGECESVADDAQKP